MTQDMIALYVCTCCVYIKMLFYDPPFNFLMYYLVSYLPISFVYVVFPNPLDDSTFEEEDRSTTLPFGESTLDSDLGEYGTCLP